MHLTNINTSTVERLPKYLKSTLNGTVKGKRKQCIYETTGVSMISN